MRTDSQKKAAANRARFWALWQAGTRREMDIAAAMDVSRRSAQRFMVIARAEPHRFEEMLAADRALEALEAGGEAPAGPPPDQPVLAEPIVQEDPGPQFDHMSVVRRICASDRADPRDRIRAAEVAERRRQFDLKEGINAGAKNLRLEDWLELKLEDIPQAARARTFGLLAEEMAHARTPWMTQAETTQGQVEVYHLLGLQVPPEEAVELLVLMAPARAAALARAAELAKLRAGPPPDAEPVDAEEYLTHVPGGEAERTALQERVRELTIRKEPGSA